MKPISANSYKFPVLILTCILLGGNCDHQEEVPVENAGEGSQTRNSRQLISLLKSVLAQANQQRIPIIQSQSPLDLYQGPVSTNGNGSPHLHFNGQSQNQGHFPSQSQYEQMQNPYEFQPKPTQSQYPGAFYPSPEQKIHSANIPQQYPLINYQTQQHSSVPHYNNYNNGNGGQVFQQQYYGQHSQAVPEVLPAPSSSVTNSVLSMITSALGGNNAGAGATSSAKVASMLSKLGLAVPEDLDLTGILNLVNVEGMLGRVNKFDKLQCIPRMICQMVGKRREEARIKLATSTTTEKSTTEKSKKSKKNNKKRMEKEDDEEEEDEEDEDESSRSGRFIKIDGMDTALDQFVKFLDLMQLRDWTLYPYVKGVYEGNQVREASQCGERFRSCPFSEDQLVYYFNNYNGGFFQSFRSGRGFNLTETGGGVK